MDAPTKLYKLLSVIRKVRDLPVIIAYPADSYLAEKLSWAAEARQTLFDFLCDNNVLDLNETYNDEDMINPIIAEELFTVFYDKDQKPMTRDEVEHYKTMLNFILKVVRFYIIDEDNFTSLDQLFDII